MTDLWYWVFFTLCTFTLQAGKFSTKIFCYTQKLIRSKESRVIFCFDIKKLWPWSNLILKDVQRGKQTCIQWYTSLNNLSSVKPEREVACTLCCEQYTKVVTSLLFGILFIYSLTIFITNTYHTSFLALYIPSQLPIVTVRSLKLGNSGGGSITPTSSSVSLTLCSNIYFIKTFIHHELAIPRQLTWP